jgi:DNA-binding MarR family transcriptional regulator
MSLDRTIRVTTIVHVTRSTSTAEQALVDAIVSDVQDVWCRMRAAGSRRLIDLGVSMSHMHVLWMLEQEGPATMSRVATSLGVSLSNVTGIVDRMEERELVRRSRDDSDRRVVLVEITPGGRRAIEELALLRREHMERVLRHLDGHQLENLRRTIEDLRAAYAAEHAEGATPTSH